MTSIVNNINNNDSPLHSILRIKRKRITGTAPLDALVIEETAPPPTKRRRNQSIPLSTTTTTTDLPIENRGLGIFRFAETVSLDSFDTDKKTRQVRDRITAFLLHPPPALARINSSSSFTSSTSLPGTPPLTPSSSSTPLRKLPSCLRAARVTAQDSRNASSSGANSPIIQSMSSSRELPGSNKKDRDIQDRVAGFHEESKRARYRIIERKREEKAGWEMRRGPLPPMVRSSKDVNPVQEPFMRIYDAVEEEVALSSSNVNILSNNPGEQDDMMDNFVPMLKEYLSLSESLIPSTSTESTSRTTAKSPIDIGEDSDDEDDDDEFVYDVYYRDLRPQYEMMDVSGENGLKRIGELAGLQDEEILTNELSSEEEDEADQDSNEENDYRNDYPSSESDGSEQEGRWEED